MTDAIIILLIGFIFGGILVSIIWWVIMCYKMDKLEDELMGVKGKWK